MITWEYRVFREEDGDYIIREVFYDDDGCIAGCTQDAVEPVGRSLKALAEDIKSFKEALKLPVLTLADMPRPRKKKHRHDRSKNLTLEQVRVGLGLDKPPKRTSASKRKNGVRGKAAKITQHAAKS